VFPVEVRYLDIAWSDPSTVLKLDCSLDPIEIEETDDGWLVQTTTFPSVHQYIGFRTSENTASHSPYFELADGARQQLVPIKAPGSDMVWWIQSSGWDKKGKRYLSDLYRTAGRATLFIESRRLILENNTFNFSVEELEYYLSDFKNSLWMIILDASSALKSSVRKEVPDLFSEEVLRLFHSFLDAVENVTEKPGMFLSESLGKRKLRDVKPVPVTFREYAARQFVRELTSRTYHESYDTAENRFIHYCVSRTRYILKSFKDLAGSQIRACEKRIEQEQAWRVALQESDQKQVDPVVYNNEIRKLTEDIESLEGALFALQENDIDSSISPRPAVAGSYVLRLGTRYAGSANAFFANTLNGSDFKKEFGTYLVVTLPVTSIPAFLEKELSRCELSVSGDYTKSRERNRSGNEYYELRFHNISAVTLVNHPFKTELSRLLERKSGLEEAGWTQPFSRQELEERALEQQVVDRKISYLHSAVERVSVFSSALPTLHRRIARVERFFAGSGVKKRTDCPNSMIFVQNPAYASAKSIYRHICESNGLDESMLNSLMAIDEIGLVNVANFYEKWCLLQIIKTLTEIYGFVPEENWQAELISAVLDKRVDVELKLKHTALNQFIVLTYEKVLESKKRPDYVIDLYSTIDQAHKGRLVIDAKFRGQMQDDELRALVRELYEGKDYSEGETNQVFVIHPSPNSIQDRTSPLVWGAQCDYGQSDNARHKYGSIFVSPSLRFFKNNINLQRLFGMFFQTHSAITDDSNDDTLPGTAICVSCGCGGPEAMQITFNATQGGNFRWVLKCNHCGLLTVQTVCSGCGETLFKNGPKWTYHRTRAEQVSNVVCPKCESFL
jgi:hypothetical protein